MNYAVEDVVEGINVKFDAGRTYVIMGANGVGKSTLLHSIMGKPTLNVKGTVEFLGQDVTDLEVDERAKLGMFIGFQAPTSIPGLSNFQFIKQVKDIPVIALSAHAMPEHRDRALKAGCSDYDTKPVDIKRLLGKIGQFIKLPE